MPMNTKKVVVGGLLAGVILNAVDFATNTFILGARMKAETDAFKPGLSEQMMTGSAITSYVIMDFVLGIALVWTYAAIRPRFGPGLRTASFAAILSANSPVLLSRPMVNWATPTPHRTGASGIGCRPP